LRGPLRGPKVGAPVHYSWARLPWLLLVALFLVTTPGSEGAAEQTPRACGWRMHRAVRATVAIVRSHDLGAGWQTGQSGTLCALPPAPTAPLEVPEAGVLCDPAYSSALRPERRGFGGYARGPPA
jgi:hypothetical protein